MSDPRFIRKSAPWVAPALVLAGFVLSGHLFARSVLLVLGKAGGSSDICSLAFNLSCDATLLGDASLFLGLPVAGWGLVYFAALFSLSMMGYLLGPRFTSEAAVGSFLLGSIGMCFSIVLLAMLASGAVAFCPLCVGVHGINFLLWLTLFMMTGRSFRELGAAMARAAQFAIGSRKSAVGPDAPWKAVGFFAVALVALGMYQWASARYEEAKVEAERFPTAPQILMAYVSQPTRVIPIAPDDARKGPSDAPITLVVFSDFQCPACRLFARNTAEYVENFGELVSIVFKHFPLDSACNPSIKNQLHHLACQAALASEAAHRHGKFWEFHDAVYALKTPLTESELDRILGDLKINREATPGKIAFSDEERVQSHIETALALGIYSTPAVFLNGRRIIEPTPKALKLLIWHNLGIPGDIDLPDASGK